MPRRPRLFVSGGTYHVFCKTHRGEMRFDGEIDARTFIDTVAQISSIHRAAVFGWVLMSNHYHLVMRTGDVKLWRSMAAIQSGVTREYNRRHRVSGSGWQSRYRARLIQDDGDLRHLLAYVHLNPVVAGLAQDPADYQLSGHRELIGRVAPVLVEPETALRSFGEEALPKARKAYLEYIRCVAETKWVRGTLRQLPWWKEVRDDYQTVETVCAPPSARTFDDKHPELPPTSAGDLNHLLTRACRLLGKSPADLAGASRRASITRARRRFAFIATCHFDHRCKAVSRLLAKSPCQVSRWLAFEAEECTRDPSEAAFVEKVVCRLLQNREPI